MPSPLPIIGRYPTPEAWEQPNYRAEVEARFWFRVDKSDTCWHWTGVTNRDGYGVLAWGGRSATVMAHRLAYELIVGPIPGGLVIDHLCRVRNCVNPEHMEPVTNAENTRRGSGGIHIAAYNRLAARARTHCPHDHPYDEVNTGWVWITATRGQRYCRECRRQSHRRWLARKRLERAEQGVGA